MGDNNGREIAVVAGSTGHRGMREAQSLMPWASCLRLPPRQNGGTSRNGRTSIGSVVAAAALRPHATAASRSGAVIT
jgi:hypothetical protein